MDNFSTETFKLPLANASSVIALQRGPDTPGLFAARIGAVRMNAA